ncbi:MAG: ATP-binding cassette domain-containing protein [Bacteroidetes bacterium]|nr:ATP-binding cassette domain-containing protein [Bacteroidota bacterium]MBU1421933.1 ATP-binding cassette domain-containing protein [Bacteroidota bacterium]MBU2471935.1 ATP-binding cassette domain-containing protein [Bacteroidota bacterium]MBU2635864.1 ATP-binding cassette domain-containing protein [Bacteroidota bacterium]
MLKVEHIRKEYSTVVAVDDVSLEVKRGEIFGLIGPNGAGKTTTIRTILNIIKPDAGQILFDGLPFSDNIQNNIGYLPEERGLYKKNKLLNTIIYFATLKGVSPPEAKKKATEWLKRLDLIFYADKKVEELSKGNQQKVQFIISILHDPELVILDEPFSGLDPVNQIVLKDIFMDLKQKGKAIIFSTHMMEQAEKLSDKICLINRGKVVIEGDLHEVKSRFGKNTVHVEFDGDGSVLKSIDGIKKLLLYENTAEFEVTDHQTNQKIMAELLPKLKIKKYELVEPSLHSIFLELVGGEKLTQKEGREAQ